MTKTRIGERTPVIIGVGQVSEQPGQTGYLARSPAELGAAALRAAIVDCRARDNVASAVDTIAVIRQFENSTPVSLAPFGKSNNFARSLGRRIGADPRRAILEISGGQGNQKLVGELAEQIALGHSELAIIAGAEAISTTLHLKAQGETRDWSETVPGELEDRGFGVEGLGDNTLRQHGFAGAIPGYALFENARRARLGRSLQQYRRDIGELFAPFTRVAAMNPHAASHVERSAEELATVSDRNRIVAEPYTRMTVARDQVNQAAAVILCSVAKARAIGVPENRWVHIHGVVSANEPTPLQRPDLSQSPAAAAATRRALEIAGQHFEVMNFIDLYSCFAIPVFNIIDNFALSVDDPRGFTLTGGLPFFGGAGNNYSMHAITEAVMRLRARPGTWGLVGANGGFMSKYAVGIYSTLPASWAEPAARVQKLADSSARLPVIDRAEGSAVVDTYTIVPRERGDLGAVVARHAASGARCVAVVAPGDTATMLALRAGEPFGRRIEIRGGANEHNYFTFTN